MDAQGRLIWEGRLNDIIKTGGFKVGAGEVEAALADHPSVREVAVVGLPGAVIDEAVRASRARARHDPPEDWGGYLQLDDGFCWDPAAQAVTHIDNQPLDPARTYRVRARLPHGRALLYDEITQAYLQSIERSMTSGPPIAP